MTQLLHPELVKAIVAMDVGTPSLIEASVYNIPKIILVGVAYQVLPRPLVRCVFLRIRRMTESCPRESANKLAQATPTAHSAGCLLCWCIQCSIGWPPPTCLDVLQLPWALASHCRI